MENKHIVPYSTYTLYAAKAYVPPASAEKTGFATTNTKTLLSTINQTLRGWLPPPSSRIIAT